MPKTNLKDLPKNFDPYSTDVNWFELSTEYTLSENFIRKYQNKVWWHHISFYQNLSESFIREFKDKVFWHNISMCQELSESFIREFKNEVDWYRISVFQKHISTKFFNKYQHRMNYKWRDIRRRYF